MYFPYLRGKQYEWLAIRELAEMIVSSERIVPIVEPVKKSLSTFHRSLDVFIKGNLPIVIVANPQVGEFKTNNDMLKRELKSLEFENIPSAHVGYVVSSDTEVSDIETFLLDFSGCNLCLIHDYNFPHYRDVIALISNYEKFQYNIFIDKNTGNRYKRKYRDFGKVLIEDGFKKDNRRNQDYPPDEFFSDLHLDYKEEGCLGFGDFLIVGNEYSDTGGPAYAVAIHITYINAEDEIWIRHFISDTNGTPVDPAGKFIEALEKFVVYFESDENEIFESEACIEFLDLYRRKHFPGLGYVKKLSLKHHIELIKHKILD